MPWAYYWRAFQSGGETVGLWAGGRFAQRDVLPDIVAAFTL